MNPPPDSIAVASIPLDHVARLAAAAVRPFATLDRASLGCGPLSPETIHALASDPAFARPIEQAIIAENNGLDLVFSRDETARLAATETGRLAIVLVAAPFEQLQEGALLCAAAAMHRQVLAVSDKETRRQLRSAFGPPAYEVATWEAPMLYTGFLAMAETNIFDKVIAASQVDEARQHLVNFGLVVLQRIVAQMAPALVPMMSTRLPLDGAPSELGDATNVAVRQLVKLVHRRLPQWSDTIA